MDDAKPQGRSDVVKALNAFFATNPKRVPIPYTPEFRAYLDILDAMELHLAMYLLWNLRVPASSIPALVPMIDQRWFQDRLESEVAGTLKRLEDAERE